SPISAMGLLASPLRRDGTRRSQARAGRGCFWKEGRVPSRPGGCWRVRCVEVELDVPRSRSSFGAGAGARRGALLPGDAQLPPLARLQISQLPNTDPHPDQPQGRQAHRGRHPPYLTVAAFTDGNGQPAGGNVPAKTHRRIAWPELRLGNLLHLRRAGWPVIEQRAGTQLIQLLSGRLAIHLHPVSLAQLVLRVGDACL